MSRLPLIIPVRDLNQHYGMTAGDAEDVVHEWFRKFRSTLEGDRRHLPERFQIVDIPRKVVGVGSVGTRAFIVLMQDRDEQDTFLQLKEATNSRRPPAKEPVPQPRRTSRARSADDASVQRHLPRLDQGIQANRYYYVRQLRDMKGSALVDTMPAILMQSYAGLCGWALARAHARSGDPIAIDAYLANTDDFDRSVNEFSRRYADQNERDYQAFIDAVQSGRINATPGV